MPSIWSRAHPRFSFRPLAINVVSELRKPRPDSRVVNFIAAQPGETLFVTDITLAEIVFGIEQMGGCHAPDRPTSVARTQFAALICRRILPITAAVILRWKTMVVAGQKRGHTFGQPDLFVAAIAALQDLVVVTRDIREFIEAAVPVFDPWASVFHIRGKKGALKAPATLEAVARLWD